MLATAQEEAPKIKVAVDNFPPFSYMYNGERGGFDIEMWDAIAKENGWEYEFLEVATVKDIVNAVADGKADIGISGITINSGREAQVDFSLPYFDSGLQLMASKEALKDKVSLTARLKMVWPTLRGALFTLILFLTIFAHSMWVVERKNNDNDNFAESYVKGIGHAYWWSLVTSTTVGYGDLVPKKALGRVLAAFVMVVGIMWFAYFTGSISAVQTALANSQPVSGLNDMTGSIIGTKAESTSEHYIKTFDNIQVRKYPDIMDALNDTKSGKIDGVVFDSPALTRFAKIHSDDVVVIDTMLNKEKYGIAMATGSPFKERINQSVLKFLEDGRWAALHKRWFE
jgi:polar amino acid transport system substrate-binding protein